MKEKVMLSSKYTPKVLLLGNGINNWSKYHSWTDLLAELCADERIVDYIKNNQNKTLPMSMQAVLATHDDVLGAIKNYNKRHPSMGDTNPFYGEITSDKQKIALQQFLSIGFDAILTTNYSYELELVSLGEDRFISGSQVGKLSRSLKERVDSKYLISSYNSVEYEGVNNKVFHIHGEARKPSSIILGSYYYASLLQKIINEASHTHNNYEENQKRNALQEYNSWIDYFILGDVYVLGFGFDFAEIDLWWLINRKKNEKANHGNVYYYDVFPDGFNEKNEMLNLMDVRIENFNIYLEEGKSKVAKIEMANDITSFISKP